MKKRIMVVDDTEDTIELVRAVLDLHGFDSVTFTDPRNAFESLLKGDLPGLLVLDVRMPHLSGFDFVEKARREERLKKLKIVYFTASNDKEDPKLKQHGSLAISSSHSRTRLSRKR